jgi:hypothetical protein
MTTLPGGAGDGPSQKSGALEAAALARNDRYLREFVEALHMCPYAKRCRESGKLHRRVVFSRDDAFAAVRAVEALPEDSVEVALLIFPGEPAEGESSAQAFVAFCVDLRNRISDAHDGDPPFYCVAFHPDLPRDLHDSHRAVQFIRRSPDPTIQLVRASVLRSVRADKEGGSKFVDASNMTLEQLMAVTSPLGLSDLIAEENLEALHRENPDRIETLLASLRSSRG